MTIAFEILCIFPVVEMSWKSFKLLDSLHFSYWSL